MLEQTPSQTVGPFFYDALIAGNNSPLPSLLRAGAHGQRLTPIGTVLDGDGAPVPDAIVEIWQADAS